MNDFEKKYWELLAQVADLRRKQKEYYRFRTGSCLTLAKKAEKKIDDLLVKDLSPAIKVQLSMGL